MGGGSVLHQDPTHSHTRAYTHAYTHRDTIIKLLRNIWMKHLEAGDEERKRDREDPNDVPLGSVTFPRQT